TLDSESQRSAAVRIYKSDQWGQTLKAEWQILSTIQHLNVIQLIGLCRSKRLPVLVLDGRQFFPSLFL
ncbi:hypothetical protein M422DRAFT_36905, partial [Sphaerobolus stellatus SS14]